MSICLLSSACFGLMALVAAVNPGEEFPVKVMALLSGLYGGLYLRVKDGPMR